MDGGYPQGGAPPPMMGYYANYSMPQPAMPQSAPPPAASTQRSTGSVSIWAGDLDSYMDENFLRNAVAACGWGADITRIKVVRDRFTGVHAGYGFLDAASPEAASRVLATGSGMPIPGSTRCWRLNMGRSASGGPAAGAETNVYVGDLEPGVTEFQLMSTFRPRYASVRHAKVVCNEFGHSRGFGFVRFGDAAEAERAVAEMQGFEFNQKPIRLSPANGRSRARGTQGSSHSGYGGTQSAFNTGDGHATNKRPRQVMAPDDPSNTTLFIGGTANHITEELLWQEFSCFGELEAVRVPANKTGFAFVRFKTRECAQRAKDELSRTHVVSLNPHKPVRLEWAAEQLAITKPPPASVASLSTLGGGQQYDSQFGGVDFVPPTAAGVPQYRVDPVRVPIGNGGGLSQPGVVGQPLVMPQLTGSTIAPHGGIRSGGVSAYGTSNGAQMGVGINATAVNNGGSEKETKNNSGMGQTTGSGETEPPSKRAAVGRSEYAAAGGGSGKEQTEAQGGESEKKSMGTEGVVSSAPFSWLSSSAPSSQPAGNKQ